VVCVPELTIVGPHWSAIFTAIAALTA